jgi:hypothetical protein
VGSKKADALRILAAVARKPTPTGPVVLRVDYLRAIDRWEELPENAPGADKTWVAASRRAFAAHFEKARLET